MKTFKSFEAHRYQRHDAQIREAVLDFNFHKAARIGCTSEQAQAIPMLNADVVKSWMIQESGGSDHRSHAAWNVDPVQVNVPGDWSEMKLDLGLKKPKVRNEGKFKANLKAGIVLLARKGFGKSGKKPQASSTFDGWLMALQRYNGRTDLVAKGVTYSQRYAETSWARASNPKEAHRIELH